MVVGKRTTVSFLGVLLLLAGGDRALGQPARSPRPGIALAYERALPDSVRRAIAEVSVLDRETGAPLAGAEVLVLNTIDLRYRSLRTDDRGLLRFAYPFAETPQANIEVRKEGYIPQRASWGFEPGAPRDEPPRRLAIRLRRGMQIGGRVVDVHGRPIEGVTVVVTVEKSGGEGRLTEPLGYEILYEVPFRTDEHGRWQTGSCPAAAREISLQLIHPDYISGGCATLAEPGLRRPPIEQLLGRSDVQVMAKGTRIEGRVVDPEGRPLANVRIVESSRGFTFFRYLRGATSGEDGRFHLHVEPGSNVQLTAEARGFAPLTLRASALPGFAPLEYRMARGRTLRGRVVDHEGKPVPAANVVRQSDRTYPFFLRTWTDSGGRFSWDEAPADPVTLTVGKGGYRAKDPVAFPSDGKETVVVLQPERPK